MDNASMTTVNLTNPANPYQLIKDVSTSSLSFGNHSSHFQFKDTRQVWSSVLSSTFYKCSPSFALITASGSTSFCEGGSVTLTTNIGNTYLWNYGPTTKSITVSTSGDYIVTVTDGNGCSATSTATTVTVNPIPPTPTISSNGSTLTSTSPTGNQWYYSSNIIPNATSDTYVPSLYGNYYTIVTLNNCSSLPSNIVSNILTNIDDISSTEKIKVYPNPTTGLIEISIKEPLKSDFRIDVVNRLGSLLKTELKKKNIKSAQIDLSSYPSDLYLIIIHTESESYQFRVIKN